MVKIAKTVKPEPKKVPKAVKKGLTLNEIRGIIDAAEIKFGMCGPHTPNNEVRAIKAQMTRSLGGIIWGDDIRVTAPDPLYGESQRDRYVALRDEIEERLRAY